MRRTPYRATLTENGVQIDQDIAYAHNSAVRASEALVRGYARTHGVIMTGDKANRDGAVYTRRWRSPGHEVIATVQPEAPSAHTDRP
ncbi:hypothetical protein NJBCHELONAE_43800 [Mycobacteroides chelonae]|uniref:hypothetical protein n=1 Tax=Mycobacteroides chelonae TaxID=1774 RepID=UPI0021DE76DA|nr:hypothetical protein [Mycobacteroides chelonae]GLE59069.1 hypothetical protein NJBCHELONAE_43800 [Mycobacteroides chelonae]